MDENWNLGGVEKSKIQFSNWKYNIVVGNTNKTLNYQNAIKIPKCIFFCAVKQSKCWCKVFVNFLGFWGVLREFFWRSLKNAENAALVVKSASIQAIIYRFKPHIDPAFWRFSVILALCKFQLKNANILNYKIGTQSCQPPRPQAPQWCPPRGSSRPRPPRSAAPRLNRPARRLQAGVSSDRIALNDR